MANRRMLSRTIAENDEFLDMPLSAQSLYFHLNLHADDDGFVSPKRIMRMVGASQTDLDIIIKKRYLLLFSSGVGVIKHWLIHNLIRTDRYKPTTYTKEKQELALNEYSAYTELSKGTGVKKPLPTFGKPNDNQVAPQVRLGKVRLGYKTQGDSKELSKTQKRSYAKAMEVEREQADRAKASMKRGKSKPEAIDVDKLYAKREMK